MWRGREGDLREMQLRIEKGREREGGRLEEKRWNVALREESELCDQVHGSCM